MHSVFEVLSERDDGEELEVPETKSCSLGAPGSRAGEELVGEAEPRLSALPIQEIKTEEEEDETEEDFVATIECHDRLVTAGMVAPAQIKIEEEDEIDETAKRTKSQTWRDRLMKAAMIGDIPLMRQLLDSGTSGGMSVNSMISTAKRYTTALIEAVASNQHAAVETLVFELDANPSLPDSDGITPLMAASKLGRLCILNTLLSKLKGRRHAIDAVCKKDGRTALQYAIGAHHSDCAEALEEAAGKRGTATIGLQQLMETSDPPALQPIPSKMDIMDPPGLSWLRTPQKRAPRMMTPRLLSRAVGASLAVNNIPIRKKSDYTPKRRCVLLESSSMLALAPCLDILEIGSIVSVRFEGTGSRYDLGYIVDVMAEPLNSFGRGRVQAKYKVKFFLDDTEWWVDPSSNFIVLEAKAGAEYGAAFEDGSTNTFTLAELIGFDFSLLDADLKLPGVSTAKKAAAAAAAAAAEQPLLTDKEPEPAPLLIDHGDELKSGNDYIADMDHKKHNKKHKTKKKKKLTAAPNTKGLAVPNKVKTLEEFARWKGYTVQKSSFDTYVQFVLDIDSCPGKFGLGDGLTAAEAREQLRGTIADRKSSGFPRAALRQLMRFTGEDI